METVKTAESPDTPQRRAGILYPVMVIAAIALIVFSVVGIVTVMGWIPPALSGAGPVGKLAVAPRSLSQESKATAPPASARA